MILKNFDFGNTYFDYESKREKNASHDIPIDGWYKKINGILTGLLVQDNQFYFLFGTDKYLITGSNKVVIEPAIHSGEKKVRLVDEIKNIVDFYYQTPEEGLNSTPFEYIDDDSIDWGMFVQNIINDDTRKKTLIKNLTDKI